MKRVAANDESAGALAIRIGQCVEAACVMEVLAPKAGNVSPGRSWNFHDLNVGSFIKSARAIRPVFERAGKQAVGEIVFESVRATRNVVSTNTNLGQILLLAPLAKAAAGNGRIDSESVRNVVRKTTVSDAIAAYEAIAMARPGGMGRSDVQDVARRPTCTLFEAMSMAAGYDDVAAQYAGGFADVFAISAEIALEIGGCDDWKSAISNAHVIRLCHGDTLVRRKCGETVETEMKSLAMAVLSCRSKPARYAEQLESLDAWLRADGNRRNPGTTADLITAGLFLGLLAGTIEPPATLFEEAAACTDEWKPTAKTREKRP